MLIIHGDNIIVSRTFYLDQKKALQGNFLESNGADLTYAQLVQSLSTTDLFGSSPTLLIEGFFSRRPSNEKKKIIENLKPEYAVLFYESKDVSAQIKSIDHKYIKNFPLPKYLYSFLETFSLNSLQSCLISDAPELVLAALAKHLHNLILVKEKQAKLPSWQLSKLQSQANKFQLDQLLQLDKLLLEIDYAHKTSNSPQSLSASLELWTLKVNNEISK